MSSSDAELYALEESLWRPETRFDRAYMDAILAAGAFEFGRSGRSYDRVGLLPEDGAHESEIDIDLPLSDFAVRYLSDTVALVTYLSVVRYDDVQVSHRSSVWVSSDGRWQLAFHQGTPAAQIA
jgi:hypothetical protein